VRLCWQFSNHSAPLPPKTISENNRHWIEKCKGKKCLLKRGIDKIMRNFVDPPPSPTHMNIRHYLNDPLPMRFEIKRISCQDNSVPTFRTDQSVEVGSVLRRITTSATATFEKPNVVIHFSTTARSCHVVISIKSTNGLFDLFDSVRLLFLK